MSVKCLHIADMHLDSPFRNLSMRYPELAEKIKDATNQSVKALVDYAIEESVDIVLIVGDSFNSTKPSVRAQFFLKEQIEKLLAHHIQVVMCYGNHDYFTGDLLVSMPQGVHVFSSDVSAITLKTQQNETVVVYGFSYDTNHITDRKINDYPVHTTPSYAIGMLHGYLEGSHSQEGMYAPFTLQELNAKHYDYWALGHIHKRMVLQENPPIVYAGNVQGLTRHETGEKGAILVCLDKGKATQISEVNTAFIKWEKISYTISDTHTLETLVADIKRQISSWDNDKIYLVSITWQITNDINPQLYDLLDTLEIKESLNSTTVYIIKESIQINQTEQRILLNQDMLEQWQKLKTYTEISPLYDDTLKNLFSHYNIRTFLPTLRQDNELVQRIFQKAINRLSLELARGGENSNEN